MTNCSNVKHKASRISKICCSILKEIFLLQMVLKMLIGAVCLLTYPRKGSTMNPKSRLSAPHHIDDKQATIQEQILMSMYPFRPEHRMSITIIYLNFALMILLYHHVITYVGGYYDITRQSLFRYLIDQKKGRDEIRTLLEVIVSDLIESSYNYSQQLIMSKRTLESQFNLVQNYLSSLKFECTYLESLKSDMISIWPINRTRDRLDRMKVIWVRLALSIYFMTQMTLVSTVTLVLITSHHIKPKDKSAENRSTLLRMGTLFDMYLAVVLVIQELVNPVICHIMSSFDVIQLIQALKKQLQDVRIRTLIIKESKLMVNHEQSNELVAEKKAQSEILGENPIININVSSLKAYIAFRYIMLECKPIKKNGEVGIDFLAIISVAILSCTIISSGDIDNSELMLFDAAILSIGFILLDFCFICYAAFNAYLLKNIRLIWSMLADSSINDFHGITISPHVKLLWVRLVHHEQTHLNEIFTLNLFKTIPLNYRTLLRFNFWFTSLFMIYRVYQKG